MEIELSSKIMYSIDNIIVEECYHECPLFETSSDGMCCGHPYFHNKKPYDNMIITQDNSKGMVPDKCPLRLGMVELKTFISLNNNDKD